MRQGRRKRQRRNGHPCALNLGFRPGGTHYRRDGEEAGRQHETIDPFTPFMGQNQDRPVYRNGEARVLGEAAAIQCFLKRSMTNPRISSGVTT